MASLKGLRVGVFWPYFEDAPAPSVEAANATLKTLQQLGATVVSINIPHLQALSLAHGSGISADFSLGQVGVAQHQVCHKLTHGMLWVTGLALLPRRGPGLAAGNFHTGAAVARHDLQWCGAAGRAASQGLGIQVPHTHTIACSVLLTPSRRRCLAGMSPSCSITMWTSL